MIIVLKQGKGSEIDIFQVPEADLENYRCGSVDFGQKRSEEDAIDLYKMEYKTCAKRYNDIYTAAWTNFSYMALFAGGILTFAGSRFVIPLTAFLACLPLLFRWIATFEPLNKYGDQVQRDLCSIETAINTRCFPNKTADVRELGSVKQQVDYANKGLTHFSDFAKRPLKGQPARLVPRVRYVVRISGCVLLITAIYFGGMTVRTYRKGQSLIVSDVKTVVPNIAY